MMRYLVVIAIWIFLSNSSHANETSNLIKEWTCEWTSRILPNQIYGKYVFNIENIDGNKLNGKFESTYCPGIVDFKGKIRNNKLSWKIKGLTTPCNSLTVKLKVAEDKEDGLILKGTYKAEIYTRSAGNDGGSVTCK